MNYKLTIALITMNRAEQLRSAITSCVAAELPEKTQFVIVDNGSTDNTEQTVGELKNEIGYDLVYHKEPVNLGAGLGRNVCFDLSEGEYIFFLDDDAEIAEDCRKTFFTKTLSYLDRNSNVASLTTEIVDKVFGNRYVATSKTVVIDSLPSAYSFHEGSVFFRKSAFSSPLYMNIAYGGEHLSVSGFARDRGFYNVYDRSVYIDHKPIVNKWNGANKERTNVQCISNIYMIKKVCYPHVCAPLLYAAFKMRLKKNGVASSEFLAEFKLKRKQFYRETRVKRIRLVTVLKAYREFGLTVF